MLTEALLYIVTPCAPWSRRAGYLRESIAIGARHNRLKNNWADHLTQTKQAIVDTAGRCSRKRRAVILGSGHGFDLPLKALASTFGRVDLVDAVHPLSMRLRARRHRGVSLIDADVTGADGPRPAYPADTDLLVSLNLISQLGVAAGIDSAGKARLRARHLTEILSLRCVTCVIGDVERLETTRADTAPTATTIEWPLPEEAPEPAEIRDWRWSVAPYGEIARDLDVSTKVRACIWG